MRCAILVGLVAAILASPPAYAEDCSAALIVSTYRNVSERSFDYRLSQFVSESDYNQLRQNQSGNAVIYGVPVGMNYDEYREASRSMIRQSGESLSEHQMENVLWTGLNDNSLAAYRACLTASRYGLLRSQVELIVEYAPTTGGPPTLNLDWSGAPADVIALMPRTLEAHTPRHVIIPRPQGKDEFLLAANGAVSDAIHVTAYPSAPTTADPPWQANEVTLNDRDNSSSVRLLYGYQLRRFGYERADAAGERHHFLFDIYDPRGVVVVRDVSYTAANSTPWEGRRQSVSVNGHTLEFAFANWNDGIGTIHYSWR
jgi:hypothetical protein